MRRDNGRRRCHRSVLSPPDETTLPLTLPKLLLQLPLHVQKRIHLIPSLSLSKVQDTKIVSTYTRNNMSLTCTSESRVYSSSPSRNSESIEIDVGSHVTRKFTRYDYLYTFFSGVYGVNGKTSRRYYR